MLESAPLYHQLADQIHALVRAGTLRAGDKVPSVRRLSVQQGVSVSTVLQAYQRLEDIGVIEARPQSGYYVRRLPAVVEEPAASKPPRRALTVDVNDLVDVVLSSARDPDVVGFGAGCPSPELFPLERTRRVMSSLALREREALGRYGLPPGTEALRRAVARRGLEWGCRIDYRNLVTTSGCMEAINLALRAVTQPGDLVALESPTYYGFLQILQTLGLRALEIPTHPRAGISLEALELALAEHPVKAILVMPNVSNPIGASMSDAAKKRLVELAATKGVPLIEDHIYADLSFGGAPARAAKAFDRSGNVILCSSFSKTLSPGLKAGWIEPGRWRDRVRTLKFVVSGGSNELVEHTLAELLETGGYERSLRQLRRRFEAHVDAARAVIAEAFPRGTRATRPSGAFILWIELPRGCDSITLFERLLPLGITIAPGPMFSASGRYRNFMRLSLGQAWSERHERALRDIGRLADELSGEASAKA
jgi:DNA-binding transcriptional MocR family regulator